jgi:hypothetical protein
VSVSARIRKIGDSVDPEVKSFITAIREAVAHSPPKELKIVRVVPEQRHMVAVDQTGQEVKVWF